YPAVVPAVRVGPGTGVFPREPEVGGRPGRGVRRGPRVFPGFGPGGADEPADDEGAAPGPDDEAAVGAAGGEAGAGRGRGVGAGRQGGAGVGVPGADFVGAVRSPGPADDVPAVG